MTEASAEPIRMAVILLYDAGPEFKARLLKVIGERQNFVIKTRYGSEDTLPALLLDLLYRNLKTAPIEDYDLRSWTEPNGCITIRGTYEGKAPPGGRVHLPVGDA